MKRILLDQLKKWKVSDLRKPMIIQGARQVGKTWLMKEFGRQCFESVIYLNFESSRRLQNIFKGDFDIQRIETIFEIESGKKISKDTLIILDEIQEAENGLTALKYFCENAPDRFILAAGSFLGVSIQKNKTFPVGKVDFLNLYPLNFEEYLLNIGENRLIEELKNQNWGTIQPFHEKLIQLLRSYYFLGGMPEVLDVFISTRDFNKTREVQKNILLGYENDFAKYAPIEIVPKIRMVWQSIVGQLSKENKKFIYGQLKEGARAKEFETAITWLVNSGLIYKCNRLTKPEIPLKSYSELDAFKLYFLDVGLLNAMAQIDGKILLEKNKILTEYKGAMTEQFVAQEIIQKTELFYWSAQNARAELDFIIQMQSKLIPIEVKAEENLMAKSLKVFAEKYNNEDCIRTSMSFYRKEEWLTNIPLYSIGFI
jgi:uncharacterized protein